MLKKPNTESYLTCLSLGERYNVSHMNIKNHWRMLLTTVEKPSYVWISSSLGRYIWKLESLWKGCTSFFFSKSTGSKDVMIFSELVVS